MLRDLKRLSSGTVVRKDYVITKGSDPPLTFRQSRKRVHENFNVDNFSIIGEQIRQLILGHASWKIGDVEIASPNIFGRRTRVSNFYVFMHQLQTIQSLDG